MPAKFEPGAHVPQDPLPGVPRTPSPRPLAPPPVPVASSCARCPALAPSPGAILVRLPPCPYPNRYPCDALAFGHGRVTPPATAAPAATITGTAATRSLPPPSPRPLTPSAWCILAATLPRLLHRLRHSHHRRLFLAGGATPAPTTAPITLSATPAPHLFWQRPLLFFSSWWCRLCARPLCGRWCSGGCRPTC